eukprot:1038194-Alexandrium_andersonii.AAC.1
MGASSFRISVPGNVCLDVVDFSCFETTPLNHKEVSEFCGPGKTQILAVAFWGCVFDRFNSDLKPKP